MSLRVKYRNYTEFSLYRFLIPELCGRCGRAIYLDSDIISLSDIAELFDAKLDGFDLLARPNAYEDGGRATSVMLMNCESCHFDLERIVDELDAGLFRYDDFTRLLPPFLERHPCRIGSLNGEWNSFDRRASDTKLLHYTDLRRQPWKHAGHPLEDLWLRHFRDALAAGALQRQEVEQSAARGCSRPDLLRPGRRSRPAGLRRLLRNFRRVGA